MPEVIPDARNNREDPECSARYGLFKSSIERSFECPKSKPSRGSFPIACDEDTTMLIGRETASRHRCPSIRSIIGCAETMLSPGPGTQNSSPPNSRGAETWNQRRRDLPLVILVARGDGDPADTIFVTLQKLWSQSSILPRSDLHAVPQVWHDDC